MSRPVVSANDWGVLDVPALGDWTPELSVTVVVPAHRPRHLPLVLASLAAQTYPSHLLEVVVADDGSEPPLTLPDIRPDNTRLVRVAEGWGRGAACQTGVEHSTGDVIHWLDADMVPAATEVEAQLRWHHAIDYAVVLGHKIFTTDHALREHSPTTLAAALREGRDPEELAADPCAPHPWIEEMLAQTDDLRRAGPRAMRVHTGASASVRRDLFHAAGGMPVELRLGEDIVLGYRLREAGAVFIPDREARALHLGESTVMRADAAVKRYNRPAFMQLVPEFRGLRSRTPRSYAVPYLEIVLPMPARPDADAVRGVLDHLLAGPVPDSVVTVLGPWDELHEKRRPVLDDELLELRLLAAHCAGEPRLRLATAAAPASSPATYRLDLRDPSFLPAGKALTKLLTKMERRHLGRVSLDDRGVVVATLDRTAAIARARLIGGSGEPGADVLRQVYPTAELEAVDVGFVPADEVGPPSRLRAIPRWHS